MDLNGFRLFSLSGKQQISGPGFNASAELNGVNAGFYVSLECRISKFDYESSTYITSLISVNSKDQMFSNFIFRSSTLLPLLC